MRLIGLAFCQFVAIIECVRWFLDGLLVCYSPLASQTPHPSQN